MLNEQVNICLDKWMNAFESRLSDLEMLFQITFKCIAFIWLPYSFTLINNHSPSPYIPPGVMNLWGTAYMKYWLTYGPVSRACQRIQVMGDTVSMLFIKVTNMPLLPLERRRDKCFLDLPQQFWRKAEVLFFSAE